VGSVGDDGFGEEEAVGQFDVVAGGAHGDRQGPAVYPQFKWLLTGERVKPTTFALCGQRQYRPTHCDPTHADG
jgi:hypothetical protein